MAQPLRMAQIKTLLIADKNAADIERGEGCERAFH
jgi:hypothetical protein